MKSKKSLNDKQIQALIRIRKEIISLSLSPERYRDTASNVSLLFETIIRALDSILAYCGVPK
jgi:hypothetical protein